MILVLNHEKDYQIVFIKIPKILVLNLFLHRNELRTLKGFNDLLLIISL